MVKTIPKKRVICAMSGGVDSSVAAALLKDAGYDVIGVFMKFWADGPNPNTDCPPAVLAQNRCCSLESEQRARKTALQLGIPFYVLDLRKEFKSLIVDSFIKDCQKGITPNPCVICNQKIKFGLLLEKAAGFDAEFIASGHYAQIKKTKKGIYRLLKSKDKNKDQSYFLWRLAPAQLSRILFPIGNLEKPQVRRLAQKLNLPAATTPESQEICFASGTVNDFLFKNCGNNSGTIVDMLGNVIGKHDGLWFYTIGQRKGIRLSGGPYYVVSKNLTANELIVSANPKDLMKKQAVLENIHWLSGQEPKLSLDIKVKVRYRSPQVAARLQKKGGDFTIIFAKPLFAVTPGQSAVFYKGNQVLGGGIIGLLPN